MKRILGLIVSIALMLSMSTSVFAVEGEPAAEVFDIPATSAILLDVATGEILYEKNSKEQLPPASITKIMTLVLTMEKIDAGEIKVEDVVTVSPKASQMTGSRVFISQGEKISVDDLIKSVVVASGNDAAVALAEYIAGSEEAFVEMMNVRAKELGMKNTNFVNAHGLDTENHYTSAFDIAIMSRELLNHDKILKYTAIQKDTLRGGTFNLVSTNTFAKGYSGATGLKTGHTDLAGYCLSASASREGLHLLSVVMGTASAQERDAQSTQLLDYGFNNFEKVKDLGAEEEIAPLKISKGTVYEIVPVIASTLEKMIVKGGKDKIKSEIKMEKNVTAPIEKGQVLGTITYKIEGKEVGTIRLIAEEKVEKMTFSYAFQKLVDMLFMKSPKI